MDCEQPQLQISGKDLGALALPNFCPRCFWIQRHTKLPWQIFPGIFSSIDSYSKKVVHGHFDKRGMPAWLSPLGELKGYINPPSAQKFRVPVKEHRLTLTGAPDAIFERTDGTLVIADYKTSRFTPNQDKLLPIYRVQLNAYAWIATQLGWPKVTDLALIYTEPMTSEDEARSGSAQRIDGFAMGFSAKILPIELDYKMLPPLLARATDIFGMEMPPGASENCQECKKLDAIVAIVKQ